VWFGIREKKENLITSSTLKSLGLTRMACVQGNNIETGY